MSAAENITSGTQAGEAVEEDFKKLPMPSVEKPTVKPVRPFFSSGPCPKRPGWSPDVLRDAFVGRSHRSVAGIARVKRTLDETRALLELPEDYLIALVPGSDTGAFEMALWSMLGARGVDLLIWESFGNAWKTDVVDQLQLADVRTIGADFGRLPDLAQVDFSRDVVFTWNGTTSGVRVPDGRWIPDDRLGLTITDATSAAFAQQIDWHKVDVATFSWQKVMGGEAAHGMLILSPRAVERLETYSPPWPIPKLFRLTEAGRLKRDLFEGFTLNTPSMLCVEDYLSTLQWAKNIGGLQELMARSDRNAAAVFDWIAQTDWVDNLAADPATWSNTSICLKIVDPAVLALNPSGQAEFAKQISSSLTAEGVAYDITAYRSAPAGLRLWTGATVETEDLRALLPWLDWAFAENSRDFQA